MRVSSIDPATVEEPKLIRGGNVGRYEEAVYGCPYCGAECFADWVDVGVGIVQCGPFYCTACKASEIGAYDEPRELSAAEEKCGWYEPGQPVSDKANTIDGVPVDHKTALREYKSGPASLLDPYVPKPCPSGKEGV